MGHIIKQIRTSKGLCQSDLAKYSGTAQGNYSKFENGQIEMRATVFFKILDRLDIPLEEYKYISNEYNLSCKESILKKFFYVSHHDVESLESIKRECENYLKHKESVAIRNVKTICKALKYITVSNDFGEAKKIALPIWDRLSKSNALYVYDMYFINAIMYIFSIDEAINIRAFLFREYKKYQKFPYSKSLIRIAYLNVSLLLIENNMYDLANEDLDLCIQLCKEDRMYLHLAVCYIRKGICGSWENHFEAESFIQKGLDMLDVLEEKQLLQIMLDEVNKYSKGFQHFT